MMMNTITTNELNNNNANCRCKHYCADLCGKTFRVQCALKTHQQMNTAHTAVTKLPDHWVKLSKFKSGFTEFSFNLLFSVTARKSIRSVMTLDVLSGGRKCW